MAIAPDLTGAVLSDRYELLSLLGEGAFGRVYRAADRRLGRTVAAKVIKPWWLDDPEWVHRLDQEARLVARLNAPQIVQIYDVGQDHLGSYYISELVDGQSLQQRLASGRLPVDDSVAIADQVCLALHEAHNAGVIHRDVKPANILLARSGQVKVTDFGIARLTTGATRSSMSGTLIGTPLYGSPEQARGQATSRSSDLYSLGAVLYEMLSGTPPFNGESPVDIALKHVSDPPTPFAPTCRCQRRSRASLCVRCGRHRKIASNPPQRCEEHLRMPPSATRIQRSGCAPVLARGSQGLKPSQRFSRRPANRGDVGSRSQCCLPSSERASGPWSC